ncbi:hypothetical protein [Aeoliella sp. SH292]|uniref:hypothetical protein n=1 Tax=Aeoliella sp. SH292 TaxID=3454464 RepID=UPI003F991C68
MRALFSLIGYVSTATLIAAAIGLLYLRHSQLITNEKVFRMVAVMHDVDLNKIAEGDKSKEKEVPPEEASLDDMAMIREVKLRDYEVKMNALEVGKQEFERSFRDINEGRQRYDQMAKELEERLNQQKELSSKENLNAVVTALESMGPSEAKKLLLMFFNEPGGKRDVILLMKAMQPNKLKKVLMQFKTEAELKDYHELQRLMLEGYPEAPEIDNMLERVRMMDKEPL